VISLLKRKNNKGKDIIALVDGEHYPQVTYDAVAMLKKIYKGSFKGIVFLGGTEKLVIDDIEDFFGEKVYTIKDIDTDFEAALKYFNPDVVYDLSDEPVVNYIIRMKIASFCLANNCSYMGPDFLFSYEKENTHCKKPTLSIIGTGKRIGKTAISSYISKIYARENVNVCVVAMGRGGPKKPRIIKGDKINITPEYLLGISNKGMHASSDYIEDALTSKVTAVGCRRCGGGFGGKIFMSNLKEGLNIAEKLNPDLIIVEGSGASIPDVETDASICVIGAGQSWEGIIGYLGIYRILSADLIVITMCEEPLANQDKIFFLEREIKKINSRARIIKTVFRPQPLSDIGGKKIFIAMTANKIIEPIIRSYIEKNFNCRIEQMSFNLGNREELRRDLEKAKDYDAILTELKAASVDVLTDYAFKHKKEVIYMNNIPIILDGMEVLEEELKMMFSKERNRYGFEK
jgi:cyclic 2,3-diphosphoglycerate synthetase